ncbi:MAG: NADH-quinone oxidoreductase subunit N [Clostridia bacterium]|jgi:NADH-quinone oxidoreductase subunit N|nr:NADH-quinone oxidoreductase subunit N [Clostridia bacterium]
MQIQLADFALMMPEIATAILAIGLLIVGLVVPREQAKGISFLTVAGLVGIWLLNFLYWHENASLFGGIYIVDPYTVFFRFLFLTAAIIVALAAKDYVNTLERNQGEFYALLVAATLGMMILAGAGDLVTLYIGLELMTITFVILVGYQKKEAKSSEAGVKYVILGAMSSAVLLYGLSLVFGFTGTTIIADMVPRLTLSGASPLLLLGIVFLVAGFGFKVSAVPFHMWSPDIYEGAPTPVTAFLAVASKAAGLAAFVRVFLIALPELQPYWITIVVVLTAITVVVGNLIAIPQSNIKRMLAFSSVAQAGYILFGLVAFSSLGVGALLFHSILYVFANIGAFAVAIVVKNSTGSDEIKDYSGLAQTSPFLAAVMLLCLLSLAGIPPVAGFVSKFYLFMAVIEKGMVWLAFVGIMMSMVSVYYYLIVAKAMYLGTPNREAKPISVSASTQIALVICLVAVIFFGVYPTPLLDLAMNVGYSFFPF